MRSGMFDKLCSDICSSGSYNGLFLLGYRRDKPNMFCGVVKLRSKGDPMRGESDESAPSAIEMGATKTSEDVMDCALCGGEVGGSRCGRKSVYRAGSRLLERRVQGLRSNSGRCESSGTGTESSNVA